MEHGDVVALSAIAEGADTLFAAQALVLGIPLEIVRPFEEYMGDFTTAAAREQYARLRAAARREVKLPYAHRTSRAYLAAMDWIVEHSDLLVVAWDGSPAIGLGGTGDVVQLVVRMNRAWVHLNVVDFSVTFHSKSPGHSK